MGMGRGGVVRWRKVTSGGSGGVVLVGGWEWEGGRGGGEGKRERGREGRDIPMG